MTTRPLAFTQSTLLAYLFLMLAPLFWGGNAVAGKLASVEWLPFQITFLRWFALMLLVLVFFWRGFVSDLPLLKQHWKVFAFLGVTQTFFNLGMYTSLLYTTAINVSILQASMPFWIMLLNYLVYRQKVSYGQAIGLSITIVGVLVTATRGRPLVFAQGGFNGGDLLMLLASIMYALYSFGLRWRPAVRWTSFLIVLGLVSSIVALPFALWELATQPFSWPSANGWLIFLYVLIFASLMGQLFFARGVAMIGANRGGLFINLVPVFGAMLSVLVLGEAFQWYHALGLVLVLLGIALAERGKVEG